MSRLGRDVTFHGSDLAKRAKLAFLRLEGANEGEATGRRSDRHYRLVAGLLFTPSIDNLLEALSSLE